MSQAWGVKNCMDRQFQASYMTENASRNDIGFLQKERYCSSIDVFALTKGGH